MLVRTGDPHCTCNLVFFLKIFFLFSVHVFIGLHPLRSASADDVHTVSGVLKKLLNELNEPLLLDREQLARGQGKINELRD